MGTKTSLDACRNGLRHLLQELGIKSVVSIDDVHDSQWISDEEYLRWAKSKANSKHESLKEVLEVLSLLTSDDAFEGAFSEWLRSGDGVSWKKANKKLVTDGKDADFSKDVTVAGELKQLFNDIGVTYTEMSPSEWKNNADTIINQSDTIPVLLMFDEVLKRPNSDQIDSGTQLIQQVLTRPDGSGVSIALVSHTIEIKAESDKCIELQNRFPDHVIMPIAKASVEIPSEIGHRIKLALIGPRLKQLRNNIVLDIVVASSEAATTLRKITVIDLDHMLLRKTGMEGSWEPDTLLRLFNLIHRQDARVRVRKNGDVTNSLPRLRYLSNIQTETATSFNRLPLQSWEFDRKEWYEGEDYINGCRLPIDFGDIFQNEDGRRFILVAPPCDLMVRPGKGRKPEFQEVLLLGIQKEVKNHDGSFELQYTDPNEPQSLESVNFVDAHHVKLWILDMCVFNTYGHAKWAASKPMPGEMPFSWLEQYDRVKINVEDALNGMRAIDLIRLRLNDEPALREELDKLIAPRLAAASNQEIFRPRIEDETLVYNFRRVDRLHPLKAHMLLSNYSAYVARAAADIDFRKSFAGYMKKPDTVPHDGDQSLDTNLMYQELLLGSNAVEHLKSVDIGSDKPDANEVRGIDEMSLSERKNHGSTSLTGDLSSDTTDLTPGVR